MQETKELENVYDRCLASGYISDCDITNVGKITKNVSLSEEFLASARESVKKKLWNPGYDSFYVALHMLVEAFLEFDKVKSYNHQCLFAFLCQKHPELELDWNFFERIRMRRNGINYYGKLVNESVWKEDSLQFELYITLLKKEIQKRLNK
jgi:hypothetical protein